MVYIPGGRTEAIGFKGTDVPAFCMDRLEVTNDDYRACVTARKCRRPKRRNKAWHEVVWEYCRYEEKGRGRHPFECATFEDAQAYCRFRGKRLPTPAQWSRAAGEGRWRQHPWGDGLPPRPDAVCWNRSKQQGSCPVGTSPQDVSIYGVLDMAGNTTEFTEEDEPQYLETRYERIMGGRWSWSDPKNLFASIKGIARDVRGAWAGIRCVRSLEVLRDRGANRWPSDE